MTIKLKKNLILTFWITWILGLMAAFILFWSISKGWIGYVPPVDQLENPIDKYATQIISSDGETLGRFAWSEDNRVYTAYEDLSPALVKALIATEDIRFAEHSGIDIQGLSRAIIKNGILRQRSAGGGSTITQQLAKLLYSPQAANKKVRVLQKPIEWVIAAQLERFYTKEEIITLYLNKFNFTYNAVGIQSAALTYFNKTPKELTTEEAAVLIGMCKNPNYYNPNRFNERSRRRRNTVFGQMKKAGYLTQAEVDSLAVLPLELSFRRLDHKEGPAPYFREHLRLLLTAQKPEKKNYSQWNMHRYEQDLLEWETNPLYGWCNKTVKPDGTPYDLYADGLKIYTTLDSRMQQYAEEAVREHLGSVIQPAFFKEKKNNNRAPYPRNTSAREMENHLTSAMKKTDRYRQLKENNLSDEDIRELFDKPVEMRVFSWDGPVDTLMSPMDSIRYHKHFLRTSMMAMDPNNGQVKAYVGGADFEHFRYDMATGGARQIGSTVKPFLYSLAMLEGFTPCDTMLHVQQHLTLEYGGEWSPNNSSTQREGEYVTLEWGLQQSSNWVSAYLMDQLSPYTFEKLLRSYGLNEPIDVVPAMALGTMDASVSQMVSAYSVFVNKGLRTTPLYVTHIEDFNGNIVATFTPTVEAVLPEKESYQMIHMLRAVIDGGTGGRIRGTYGLKAPMGGKTGTTQKNADGWFMNILPNLVGGVWVGGEEPTIRFDHTRDGQGANTALPIYARFLQKVYADPSLGYFQDEEFDIPEEYTDPCTDFNNTPLLTSPEGEEYEFTDSFFNDIEL